MKKQSHLFIFLLLFTGVFFSECKKYPEDDVFIQCRRPEKRLIKYGPWVFDKLTVDGVDKSAEFRADSAYFDRMEFIEPESDGPNLGIYHNNDLNEIARFKLIENDEILRIEVIPSLPNESNYPDYGPIFIGNRVHWNILRLSKKGLIIETTFNGQVYKLELKPEN